MKHMFTQPTKDLRNHSMEVILLFQFSSLARCYLVELIRKEDETISISIDVVSKLKRSVHSQQRTTRDIGQGLLSACGKD